MLSTLGPDGASTLRTNPDRIKEVNREVEAMGVKVLNQWALLGQFDFCTVVESPDMETMSKVALSLAARGTLKTQTLGAIPTESLTSVLKD